MTDIFDIAAQSSVGLLGQEIPYTADGASKTFSILIERNLQVMDDDSGATQYINAASFAHTDFPFDRRPRDGDTIAATGRTWRVVRIVSDDGYMYTVEVR